jgi:hypothetical protein
MSLKLNNFKQQEGIYVEVIQLNSSNCDDVYNYLKSLYNTTEIYKTYLDKYNKNKFFFTIYFPSYCGTIKIHNEDFLIKYTESKDISFLVLNKIQFNKRYISTVTIEKKDEVILPYNAWNHIKG